jgi:protein-disulfide isomerase
MMRNAAATLTGIVLASLGFGCAIAEDKVNFTVLQSDEVLGSNNAPVTLVQYGSPSCPVCAHFDIDAFPLIKRKYIDTGKVRFVFRVFPLRPEDGDAEKLARCATGTGYFQFMDILFRNQMKWDPEFGVSDSRTQMISLATASGLTEDQAIACLNDRSLDARINKIAQDAQAQYGISGTPMFIIDGSVQRSGFRSLGELTNALDIELAKRL